MIQTQGLSRDFGTLKAVDDLNLEIAEGEVFGLLGPNGAGKTTTVRMLACLIAPSKGEATVAGGRVGRDDGVIRERVGVLPEAPGLYERLTVQENLEFFAGLYGVKQPRRAQQIDRFLEMLDLGGRRDELAGALSQGMKQKVALARALIHEPEVLFLDEPTANLDPEATKTVRDFLDTLRHQKRTILLCTHNLPEAERICDRVGILSTRLLAVEEPARLTTTLYGHSVLFRLRGADHRLAGAVQDLPGVKQVRATEDGLLADVEDPPKQNPAIVRRLVELGAEVQFVEEQRHSLEEAYLAIVRGSERQ